MQSTASKMPARCILPTCSNTPDKEKCMALHPVPFFNDERPEAKRRRKRWIDFIHSTRADHWEVSEHSTVCSAHFTRDCFTRKILIPGTAPRLITDDIGVVPYPTILRVTTADEKHLTMSERTRRRVSGLYFFNEI